MSSEIPPYVYIIFTAATSIGVLMQAFILLGIFIGFRRLQGKIETILNHTTEYALPLIVSSKTTLEELSPKLKVISANLVEISETLKHETHNIKGSVDDVLDRTRAQTARVDEMVSGTLDGLTSAGAAIQQGVSVPLRHIHGLFNGLRAGLQTLRSKPVETRAYPPVVAEEPEVIVIVEEVVLTTVPNI